MYTDIENRVLDLAACKGLAFEDSSMEEDERELNEMLDEEKKLRKDDDYDGRRSDNSELLRSVIS